MKERIWYRTYTQHIHNGKHIVVAWIQKQCEICKRFLSKHQLKYCSRCADKRIKEKKIGYMRKYRMKYPDKYKERMRIDGIKRKSL